MGDLNGGSEWQDAGDELPQARVRHRALASGDLAEAMELREFLTALGPVMRLPDREAERQDEPTSKSPVRQSRLLMAALAVVAVGVAWGFLSRWNPGEDAVPESLLGTWTTATPRYADRGFVITADSLRLRVGSGQTVAYPIEGVRRAPRADSAVITLHYRDGGDLLEMGLRLGPQQSLSLANLPEVIWRREGS